MVIYSLTSGFTDAETGQTFKSAEAFRDPKTACKVAAIHIENMTEATLRGEMSRFFVGIERRTKHEGKDT